MFFKLSDLIVFAIGLLLLAVWMGLYLSGRKYAQMFEGLDEKDYPMGDTYFVGYALTLRLNLDYKNKECRKLRRDLSALYEPKYTDYYLRVIYSMRYTMALTVACFAAPLYFLSGELLLFVLLLAGAVGIYFYYGAVTQEMVEKRSNEVMSEFSEVVSKLALLVNSGMIVSDAWARVAGSGDSVLYQEMRKSVDEMKNGRSFADALYTFAQRSLLPAIKKFSSTLIQGVSRGNSDLAPMLTQQSKEIWELKRQMIRREGELANNKLLLPMCLTFIGILIMIMVPIFTNLGA